MLKKYRIFLTLNSSASSGGNDEIWKQIFNDNLISLGQEVDFFCYKEAVKIANGSKNRNTISQIILDKFYTGHKKKRYDIFLSYYNESRVVPEMFSELNKHVFTINYTTNFHQIDLYKNIIRVAELSTYASYEAKKYFESNAKNSYYLPFAASGNLSREPIAKDGKISFIGTSYGNRPYYLWRCLQKELPLEVYGLNWKKNYKKRFILRNIRLLLNSTINKNIIDELYRSNMDYIRYLLLKNYKSKINDPLSDSEYFNLISKSSIVLNLPESRYMHNYFNPNVLIGANLRDFEVPNSGGCLMTQNNEEILSFYKNDKEIITFSNEWELVDKLRYYLDRPNKIDEISINGHKKTIKYNLWTHRFSSLLNHFQKIN